MTNLLKHYKRRGRENRNKTQLFIAREIGPRASSSGGARVTFLCRDNRPKSIEDPKFRPECVKNPSHQTKCPLLIESVTDETSAEAMLPPRGVVSDYELEPPFARGGVTRRRTVGRRSCCSRERDFRDINLTAEPPLFAAFIVRWVAPTSWSCAEIILDAWKGVTQAPKKQIRSTRRRFTLVQIAKSCKVRRTSCPTRPIKGSILANVDVSWGTLRNGAVTTSWCYVPHPAEPLFTWGLFKTRRIFA